MALSQPINPEEPLGVERSRKEPVHSRVRFPEYEDWFTMKLKGGMGSIMGYVRPQLGLLIEGQRGMRE